MKGENVKEEAIISAAIPRPGNKPYYLDPDCPECGTPLVLLDVFKKPDASGEEIWHDEFICPVCRDGLYVDWPENKLKD